MLICFIRTIILYFLLILVKREGIPEMESFIYETFFLNYYIQNAQIKIVYY